MEKATTGLSRRGFLRVAVVSGTAIPFITSSTSAPGAEPAAGADATVVGTIVAVTPGDLSVRQGDRLVKVVPQPGARMYSGSFGEVNSPSGFLVGDRIAAEGRHHEGRLEATSIGSARAFARTSAQRAKRGDRS